MNPTSPAVENGKIARQTWLRWAQVGAVALGLIIALTIFLREITAEQPQFNFIFFVELIIYAGLLPFLATVMLHYLAISENERDRAFQSLNRQLELSQTISTITEWNDLVDWVSTFPATILPVNQVRLFVFDLEFDRFEPAQAESADPTTKSPSQNDFLRWCRCCIHQQNFTFHTVGSDLEKSGLDPKQALNWHVLPLLIGNRVTSLLFIEAASDEPVSPMSVQILNGLAPEIAFALERAYQRSASQSQAAIAEAERRAIAQDLHDTLGQNVAFLRLKLDQILVETSNNESSLEQVRPELERMREISDEAYIQVRQALTDLNPENTKDLAKGILDIGRRVGDRSGFKMVVRQYGTPRALRPNVKRQVLYICREAFNNIEKHAHASQVEAEISWEDGVFSLKIIDNGLGFALADVDTQNHFGLGIMRDRAQAAGGTLEIQSQLNKGTIITLKVPLPRAVVAGQRSSQIESMTVQLFVSKTEKRNEDTNR